MHHAAAQGSGVHDTVLCGVLVDLDISRGKPPDKAAVDADGMWVKV